MASRPIRVAMIGQKGYPPVHGGIEKHVAELAARLPGLGCEVDIYSRPHYSDTRGTVDLPGVRVHRLPSIPSKHLDAISHTIVSTAHVLFQNADVVHYHALGPGLLSGVPRLFKRLPTVVTVHGLDWQRDKWGSFARGVLRVGESASVGLPDRTIVVSRSLREHYLEQHKRATDYIPNGIVQPVYREPMLIREQGIEKDYVLFVGRLVPEKGCHLLLEAWRQLPASLRARFDLVIAGDAGFTSSYVEKLHAMAPEGVRFLGYVHGPILEELYTNTSLVVLPSTLEGLSITLLEGMSYARCCLVSDIPPNIEGGGDEAVYFESGNVRDLGRQLAALLDDPEKRARSGEGAQVRAIENYSWERVAAMTADLYRELVPGRSAGPF
ncbi:MAG: glycosyltransferase family 4 protein [Candidatus Krumholzibacteriota bacterium]